MKSIISLSILLFSFHAFSDTSNVWQSISELQNRIAADKAQVEKLMMSGFTDKFNGLRWSINLPGTYTNGCEGQSNKGLPCTLIPPTKDSLYYTVGEDSEAQLACRKLGGRLPTVLEFTSLLNNFRPKYVNGDVGNVDMEKLRNVFGNGKFNDINSWYSSEQYWSSSIDLDYDPRGYAAKVIGLWNPWQNIGRQASNMVRCVFESK